MSRVLDIPPSLDAEVMDALPDGPLGVALSGGGDSLALLHLLHEWGGRPLRAVTVDHGLRVASMAEALRAGEMAAALNIPHQIFKWGHEGDITGNLQDAARAARRRLIADWARETGLGAVALGHTADDQAETFLMRLARGSGLDGLASMDGIVAASGVIWARPLLHVRRGDLRDYLKDRSIGWIDDPSNEDTGFERVRVREALDTLDGLGIDVPRIEKTTRRLKSAKQVLYVATKDLGLAISEMSRFGELTMRLEGLLSAQLAIQLRLLSDALRYVSGAYYGPRSFTVQAILDELPGPMLARSLHGCLISATDGVLRIRREPSACESTVEGGAVWDGRWMVSGPFSSDMRVGALGESGLAARPDWRESNTLRAILLTTPAVWQADRLISAPLLDISPEWTAEISLKNDFFPQ